MLAKKKKLSKKVIKEDKLVTSFYETKKFYEQNQTKIVAVVGVIAVIIIAVVLYSNRIEENNFAASAELTRVLPIYNSGSYQEAIDGRPGTNVIGLQKIVDEYGNSEQGELAKIYLANAFYFMGDIDAALEYFEDYSGSNKDLVAAALAGKASCFEVKEDYKLAAEFYNKAANENKFNPSNPDYLLKAGINYIKVDQLMDAKNSLQEIKDNYKTSSASREVDRYLAVVDI
ncbi:MAG: tetratricopeptide repeat protein [Melioribacteraceae bacterium]|nr:tetratricopeptide repeat protein [Melioribacteraceae bacterium]